MQRFLLSGVLAVHMLLPVMARAELVLTGGNLLIGAQGGPNQFGNLSSDYRAYNSNEIVNGSGIDGFPSAGSANPIAAAASASLDFSFTQVGDFAVLTQTISQYQAGVTLGLAEHRFTIEFTAINDLNFQFTSNWDGLGTAGSPTYYAALFDVTLAQNVFADDSLDPLDLIPVENHSGTLTAGHMYSLLGTNQLRAGDPSSNVPANASGIILFTTSPVSVPEPNSLALASFGCLCWFGWTRRKHYK